MWNRYEHALFPHKLRVEFTLFLLLADILDKTISLMKFNVVLSISIGSWLPIISSSKSMTSYNLYKQDNDKKPIW